MKNKILPIFLLILLCYLAGCYFDTDTAASQNSDSIAASKKDSFFLNEYKLLDKEKKSLSVKEAWVEYMWRYETIALGISRKKTKIVGLNFNLILEDTSRHLNINNYSKTWDIKTNMDEYMGLISGQSCYLIIEKRDPPDSIYLIVSKIDSGFIVSKANSKIEDVVFVKKK
jgi:hypothetical protein